MLIKSERFLNIERKANNAMKSYYLFICTTLFLVGCGENQPTEASRGKCIPNQPCVFQSRVKLALSTTNVIPETPFQIILQNEKTNVEVQTAYIEGVNMYMGKIPLFFELKDGKLVADAMLGVCNEPQMQWQIVISGTTGTPFEIRYPFSSTQR